MGRASTSSPPQYLGTSSPELHAASTPRRWPTAQGRRQAPGGGRAAPSPSAAQSSGSTGPAQETGPGSPVSRAQTWREESPQASAGATLPHLSQSELSIPWGGRSCRFGPFLQLQSTLFIMKLVVPTRGMTPRTPSVSAAPSPQGGAHRASSSWGGPGGRRAGAGLALSHRLPGEAEVWLPLG